MGYREAFGDKPVLIAVIDTLPSEYNILYWVQGKIADETDKYLVIDSPSIGYETYTISNAEEVIINKEFIAGIDEASEMSLEKKILERYYENRVDWAIGLIFFAFGAGIGMISSIIFGL